MKTLNLPFWDFFKSLSDAPEYFDKTLYWCCFFISILILAFIVVMVYWAYSAIYDSLDRKRSTKEIVTGDLIDKRYVGEQSSTGTGTAILPSSGGGLSVGIVSTSSSSPEEFLLFIKASRVYKIECDMQQFYSVKVGDKVRIEISIGGLSKKEINYKLAEN